MTAAPLLPEIRIDDRVPRELARAYLESDRLLAAYALADLDTENVDRPRWWAARREGEIVALALLVETLPFRPCFAMGETAAVSELFREGIHEPRLLIATPPSARLAVETSYRFERIDTMYRMAVTARTFRPRVAHAVTRLGPEHVDDVIDLYGHASRTYFTPQRLGREIYFGVYVDGTLVSAAGTHVRSTRFGIAAVGNVLTRVAYRGRGLATSCTSKVTEFGLEDHPDIVLNVRADNTPAIGLYERLGYTVHTSFVEGPAVRRAAWERLIERVKR